MREKEGFIGLSSMRKNQGSVKILHVLDHSLPIHSGYAFRTLNILREQQSLGWRPSVVTSPKHEIHSKQRFEGEESVAGITHYRTAGYARFKVTTISELLLMRSLKQRLAWIVKKERPDIIHVHSPILNCLPALWVGRTARIPIVYEVRALWEDAAVDHGTYTQHSWKYKSVRFLETFVCKRANEVVVISDGLKRELIGRGVGSHKLTVVSNGVNVDQFERNKINGVLKTGWNLQRKEVVAFIGSFYRYEGLDLLLEAVARLSSRRPALRVLLVGGGEVEEELRRRIHDLQLDDKVIIPGRIPHDEVPGVYEIADILVYPRRSMRLTEIVTPLKPLEAMAMGKAIIASDVGGHRELIEDGHTGILFRAGSATALAKALDRVLKQEDLRRSLETQAAAWVRRERSWKKTTAAYVDVYSRALGGNGFFQSLS